jgi:hypothetical protein
MHKELQCEFITEYGDQQSGITADATQDSGKEQKERS